MKLPLSVLALVATLSAPSVGMAESANTYGKSVRMTTGQELPPYLQCVPYAREQSGIEIYGDAHTWWDKAEGNFARGNRPKVGAVMAFQPHRNMQLGHVAAVSKVIDSRTVLLRHSNWSPINGRRGQIENDVKAIDVSLRNDWSAVRVWYHPIQALGKTEWPIHGFIYSDKAPNYANPVADKQRVAVRSSRADGARQASTSSADAKPSADFTKAFAELEAKPARRHALQRQGARPANPQRHGPTQRAAPRPARQAVSPQQPRGKDPVLTAISLYD